jgi:hypothetical protein
MHTKIEAVQGHFESIEHRYANHTAGREHQQSAAESQLCQN